MDIMIKRKPMLNRYKKISNELKNSLLNAGKVEWIDTSKIEFKSKNYNIIDLFCGSGGLSLGFELAGFNTLFGIDIDGGTSKTYRNNFPNSIQIEGRIENLEAEETRILINSIPLHVLCAGFPCPGFSMAGKKNDYDERNFLYKEIVRITKELRPLFIVLENVPRLVSLKEFLFNIYKDFTEIGYNMSVLIHESAKYEVPQLRPRTIFIGNRLGLKNPHPKPLLTNKNYISIETAIDDLKDRPRDPKINHEWTKHSNKMIERISHVPPGGSLYETYLDAWKRQYKGVPSMTIKENHGGNHIHHELNRVLSAREMARLQSFPDSFIFQGTMKRTLFQIGNSVPPYLAKHIALAIRTSLNKLDLIKPEIQFVPRSQVVINYEVKRSFELLLRNRGDEILTIYDVYIDDFKKKLIYYPIYNLDYNELVNTRDFIKNNLSYKLFGVELTFKEIVNRKPRNNRRKGCFRKIEWFTPNFMRIPKPYEIMEIKKHLELDSKWLSGGPRPNYLIN